MASMIRGTASLSAGGRAQLSTIFLMQTKVALKNRQTSILPYELWLENQTVGQLPHCVLLRETTTRYI
jgi:hypothetical protein